MKFIENVNLLYRWTLMFVVSCSVTIVISEPVAFYKTDPLDRLERQVNPSSEMSFGFDAAGNRTHRILSVDFSLPSVPAQATFSGIASVPITISLLSSASPEFLSLSARSSNRSLVPGSGFSFGGSGANRSLVITPAAGQTGTTTITLIASDGSLATATQFQLTVFPPEPVVTIAAYDSSFDGGAGAEWSHRLIVSAPDVSRRFLGEFGSEGVTLTLNHLLPHEVVELSFDLAVINAWVGSTSDAIGPDIWTLAHSGDQILLRTTFAASNAGVDALQNFPGFVGERPWPANTGTRMQNVLGFPYHGQRGFDAVYRLHHVFSHTNEALTVSFDGTGLKGINGEPPRLADKSWALDNVKVRLVHGGQPVLYQNPLGSVLRLNWPERDEMDALESVDSLNGSEWRPTVEAVSSHGRELSTLVLPGTGSRFFRLHQSAGPVLQPSDPPAVLVKRSLSAVPVSAVALGDDGDFYGVTSVGIVSYRSDTLLTNWHTDWQSRCRPGSYPISITAQGLLLTSGDANECGNGPLFVLAPIADAVRQRFNYELITHPRQVVAIDDTRQCVYFGHNQLFSIDSTTFIPLWSEGGGEPIGDRGLILDSQGNIFVGSFRGTGLTTTALLSFSPTNPSSLRWKREYPGDNGPAFAAAIGTNVVLLYYQTLNRLLALNSLTGENLWQAPDLDNPVADRAANLYANARSTAEVVSLTIAGQERWRTTLPDAPGAQVDFIDSQGRVVARGGNQLFVLNASDGTILWTFTADASLVLPATLAVGGRLHVIDSAGSGYLLDTTYSYAASDWPIAKYANRRHTMKAGDVLPLPTIP